MQSKIVATVLGLVAEIERDFISSRTKEALAKRKSEGLKLGHPVGAAKNLKLDKHADKIDGYLAKGINKVAIAKLLDVSPNMGCCRFRRHRLKLLKLPRTVSD